MTGRALTARERSRRAYARKKERMASDPEYKQATPLLLYMLRELEGSA